MIILLSVVLKSKTKFNQGCGGLLTDQMLNHSRCIEMVVHVNERNEYVALHCPLEQIAFCKGNILVCSASYELVRCVASRYRHPGTKM